MKDGGRELLTLLRAFVEERVLTETEAEGLDRMLPQVIELAKLHNVMGIWAYKIREFLTQKESCTREEQDVLEVAQRVYHRTISRSVLREAGYLRLAEEAEKRGIDQLAFKGIGVKDLYPVPELRTFGDIDLAVRKEQRAQHHAMMEELGYTATADFEPVYTYQREQEIYEVHTSVMSVNITDRADYIGYFGKLWEYAREKSPHRWEFTPEYHFVYLLSHIAKHIYSSGAGIRMYLDLAFYIQRLGNTMDWERVQKEMETLALSRFFALTMDGIRRWFGVTPPIELPAVEDGLFARFEDFTLAGGIFGFAGKTEGEELVRKQTSRKKAIRESFFPPGKSIRARYTYLQKCPWLLPVAWADRLLRNLGKVNRKLEETKEIVAVDESKVKETIAFYRRIGL